jgi:hypothetical protein
MAAVAGQRHALPIGLPIGDLPQTQRAVPEITDRRQRFSIGGKRHVVDDVRQHEPLQPPARARVGHPNLPVLAGGGQQLAVGA